MVEPIPLRDKLRVRVLEQRERSSVIATLPRETPLRRCTVLAKGPDAGDWLIVGQTVLCNILAGQAFGDDLVLPSSAVVAILCPVT